MENPAYIVVNEEGPQHSRTFTVKVIIGDSEFGTGQGRNKKSAEQDAAKAAMIKFLQES
jgi:ribonuclease-3